MIRPQIARRPALQVFLFRTAENGDCFIRTPSSPAGRRRRAPEAAIDASEHEPQAQISPRASSLSLTSVRRRSVPYPARSPHEKIPGPTRHSRSRGQPPPLAVSALRRSFFLPRGRRQRNSPPPHGHTCGGHPLAVARTC